MNTVLKHCATRKTVLCLAIASLSALSACTFTSSSGDSINYKSAGEKKTADLSVPPDLTMPSAEKRYSVADGSATLSQYNSTKKVDKTTVDKNSVTPAQAGIRVEKDGNRRWLVVSKTAETVYPKVRSFWEDSGFLLAIDSPNTGIMETDWAENRAKIPDDMVRRFLGSTLDSIYSTGERDKFRTRFEKNAKGETEIYVTHRGAEEKLQGTNNETSMWTSRPADPELEAEMLARMMVYLGTNYEGAKAALGDTAPASKRAPRVVAEGSSFVLPLNQEFDRAWREVGLTLDRSNFTVEDRNRSEGIYYVRYVNEKDYDAESKTGWFSGWFSSSKKKDLKQAKRYEVVVKSSGNQTSVRVNDEKGGVADPTVAKQILTIIDGQVSY